MFAGQGFRPEGFKTGILKITVTPNKVEKENQTGIYEELTEKIDWGEKMTEHWIVTYSSWLKLLQHMNDVQPILDNDTALLQSLDGRFTAF